MNYELLCWAWQKKTFARQKLVKKSFLGQGHQRHFGKFKFLSINFLIPELIAINGYKERAKMHKRNKLEKCCMYVYGMCNVWLICRKEHRRRCFTILISVHKGNYASKHEAYCVDNQGTLHLVATGNFRFNLHLNWASFIQQPILDHIGVTINFPGRQEDTLGIIFQHWWDVHHGWGFSRKPLR